MPDILLLMIGCWSFLISTCGLTLEAARMGGGATVVERFDDGVQMNVGAVQMIRIYDVLMNLVDVVGLSRFGVCRMSVVGVVQMILVSGDRIHGVDWLM
jgi:hypothetical protein